MPTAPSADGGRDGLLAQIRGGAGGLKKASDRPAPAAPAPTGGRNALLDEITKGKALKKVVVDSASTKPEAAAPTMGGLSVAAILNRRAALAGSDEDDSDSDDSEWDD